MRHRNRDSDEYESKAAQMVDTKPKHMILSIKPMTEANAREWLGAANKYGDGEMVDHFVGEVERLSD
jgi:hypothetical protein